MNSAVAKIAAAPTAEAQPARVELVRLHRRRQRVVVRAGDASPTPLTQDRRLRMPTLPGLGVEPRFDTLPDWDADDATEPAPVSHVRPVLRLPPPLPPAPVRPRRRPETLLDGVDDDRSRAYLAEARRILESGYFETSD